MNYQLIDELCNMFNEKNKKQPKHSSFVKIESINFYPEMAENGAILAVNFNECTFGKTFQSKFEFSSEENLINYLRQHSI